MSSKYNSNNNTIIITNSTILPILLVHGYMEDASVWNKWVDLLKKANVGLDPYFWEHFSHYFMDIIFHYQYLSPSPPQCLVAFSILK